MSEYYNTAPKDINIDKEDKEVDIYVKHDECGSIYAILTFDQINKLHEEINAKEEWI